jgi:hypothetical protein
MEGADYAAFAKPIALSAAYLFIIFAASFLGYFFHSQSYHCDHQHLFRYRCG